MKKLAQSQKKNSSANTEYLQRLDKQVSKLLFSQSKARAYSSSRDLAGCVLERIVFHVSPKIRRKFNNVIEKWYGRPYLRGKHKYMYAHFLLEVAPVAICEAVVIAFRSNRSRKL